MSAMKALVLLFLLLAANAFAHDEAERVARFLPRLKVVRNLAQNILERLREATTYSDYQNSCVSVILHARKLSIETPPYLASFPEDWVAGGFDPVETPHRIAAELTQAGVGTWRRYQLEHAETMWGLELEVAKYEDSLMNMLDGLETGDLDSVAVSITRLFRLEHFTKIRGKRAQDLFERDYQSAHIGIGCDGTRIDGNDKLDPIGMRFVAMVGDKRFEGTITRAWPSIVYRTATGEERHLTVDIFPVAAYDVVLAVRPY